MQKIADTVSELLIADENALQSFKEGVLNLSAYAAKIHRSVETLSHKSVKKGTIIVALSRLSKTALKSTSSIQNIKISHLSTRSPLTSFTYLKTMDTERKVSTLNPYLVSPGDLFGIIEGESEVVLICSEKVVDLIKDHIGVIPKREASNLVAITLQFPKDSTNTHDTLHLLLSLLAAHKVDVFNVIPTSTEISFVVERKYMESAISALNLYMDQDPKN